jgi:hypothetical protein
MSAEPASTLDAGNRATQIAKLTVYHLGILVFTETALTGAALEARPDVKKFETTDRVEIDETLAQIERAAPAPSDSVCDARWGLVFAGAAGERVKTLYLNAFGTTGDLDGTRVTFASDVLVEWLRERYGPDFELSQ